MQNHNFRFHKLTMDTHINVMVALIAIIYILLVVVLVIVINKSNNQICASHKDTVVNVQVDLNGTNVDHDRKCGCSWPRTRNCQKWHQTFTQFPLPGTPCPKMNISNVDSPEEGQYGVYRGFKLKQI